MAEPQGISRTLRDLGNFGNDVVRNVINLNQDLLNREAGFKRGADQAIDNVLRYFASQEGKPLDFSPVGSKPATTTPRASNAQTADAAARRAGEVMPTVNRNPNPTGPTGPAAPAVNPLAAIFNPQFESLNQREQMANQRYEANKNQVTNIYGQITNARSADIATTGTAYQRLIDAASTRSAAVNTQIDESEATRLRNNQAALESMGLGGLSTAQGDIASQGAAMAKNTNRLNAENWNNLLTAMGANAQDIARSDVTGFNYRMGEDLGRLRGAREEFAQQLGQERTNLVSQQAQATFDFQQAQQRAAAASAAAAQKAAQDSADAASKQFAEALKASGPLLYTVSQLTQAGALNAAQGANVMNVITEWTQNVPSQGNQGWKASTAANSILAAAGANLSPAERQAIVAVTGQMFPQG
jgi:hypothetical protein